MGILDDILSPIKDIIGALQKPVQVVKNLFGEVIDFTEQIVQSFIEMLDTLKDLFNASQVEMMFLNPFKDAVLTAVNSIEKLLAIASQADIPTTDGIQDLVKNSISLAYQTMRTNLSTMTSAFDNFISEANTKKISIPSNIHSEFTRTKTLVNSLPTDLAIISSKIKDEFAISKSTIFSVAPDFANLGSAVGSNVSGVIRVTGSVVAESFSNIEQSVHKRFENENVIADFLYIAIFIMIISIIIGLFALTKSFFVASTILIIFAISFIVFAILY